MYHGIPMYRCTERSRKFTSLIYAVESCRAGGQRSVGYDAANKPVARATPRRHTEPVLASVGRRGRFQMGGIEVRQASVADAASVARVHVRAWQVAYAGIVPGEVLAALDPVERADRWRTRLGDPHRADTALVAATDGVVVGFSCVGPYRIDQDFQRLDPEGGELYSLYVDPERWRMGAGRALMTAALTHLARNGSRSVRLWVLADNRPARRFYERCGFVADGAAATYTAHRPDGTAVDLDEVRYTNR